MRELLEQQLEEVRTEYWDAQDNLGRIGLKMAGILNALQEMDDE